ncbi:methionyl-tRNA synthetase [Catalinimonas alkaloidigena]|uniref:Methionine--tRNA ligase n=1 Tax=Catalinimonas alkaloidigena TaxID=1075417 RepID=A0A1G9MWQ9_9BACT|nr:methionine--tRNA ligase [Catalinimonas alkaloidigena]SDL78574.1 methionyl-tRNA synthetase [Catalinimonas alkaloidigena]
MAEEKNYSRYTVTAALPYANGPLHIGHIAGVYVPADIYVRYRRLRGDDVVFVCGSDEHGVPITIRAQKEGVTPQQIADKYDGIIRNAFQEFGIAFDIYARTSNPVHHETAAEFFKTLYDKGEFVEQASEQFYDEEAGQFLADRYIQGICPVCSFDRAYGDQCENCGSTLSPSELKEPRSMLSGSKPVLKTTRHWYLPLDKYEPWLREWILEGHKEWKPNVYGQCKSWLDGGLQPRAMTRDLDWGVKVPLPNTEGKVLYVWFDAPIGYVSATKEWAAREGVDWKPYWQSDSTKLVHFIGKDNIVFHCIIFPAILHAHGDYILPDNVPANEFLNLEGEKISTSRNWAVWLHEYLEDFPDKQDVLRYMLCATAPETKDNDFTWKEFQARNNNELVAVLGNFVNRALVLTHKYFEGKVPPRGQLFEVDTEAIDELKTFPSRIATSLEGYRFREAMQTFMDLARLGNKYLADTEPWQVIKTNKERTGTILNIGLQIAANLAVLGAPLLPFTAEKINALLNLSVLTWQQGGSADLLAAGATLEKPTLLFTKIEDEAIEQQLQKLNATRRANTPPSTLAAAPPVSEPGPAGRDGKPLDPARPEIVYDDFAKLDVRVATILAAERVPKTDKLMKLTLDTGLDQRTVVSGIAEYHQPEAIIGKQVCVLVNLAPRKLKGIESQGMILMAEDSDGRLVFVAPDQSVAPGSGVS